ncbi:MAG: CO2 hydration protein, partial [Cyanobacteriota bacterium]
MTPPTATAPETVTAPLIPPSTHRYADVIHRLEAGGSMLPDTPENLMQIIGIYKAYAVPM